MAQERWNSFYDENVGDVKSQVPSSTPYNATNQGVAYWQWAKGYTTTAADPTEPSVVNSTSVAGYPEFSFWLEYFCNPEHQGNMSQANYDLFKNIKMYRDDTYPWVGATNNMEHLFDIYNINSLGDPSPNSLFNLTTLKALVTLG